MSEDSELRYTLPEVRSFLTTGWNLESALDDAWQPDRRAWVATLRDGSELSWEVSVGLDEARTLGRSEALRRAIAALKHHL